MIVKEQKEKVELFDKLLELVIPQDKNIIDILPYKNVLEDGTAITSKDTYQAFLKVKTNDLTSISDGEFMRMVNKLTYLNRVYLEPFKIISLTYPTEVIEQMLYWKHRIACAKRDLLNNKKKYLEKYFKWNLKLAYDNYTRIEFVSTLPELTFSIIVYGKTKKELKNHVDIMKQAGGKELDLQIQKEKDVTNIIKKLLNMNSPI
ncbi:hypothetical protein [Clostridium sporogenes]|uniref:hypothetical protein n=1 Tax=Clostridium sporogenes TaxID=1509 RepID=UPI0007179794|nr:hypothetical protein [Clostridium sporogenes]KRU39998.1 hypothetical protein VT94_24750 [Clostridium sporogenes]MBY7065185.1 hypothetical protein [Clostridium sporogenes]MBY7071845.1 hypothetical protein [Clostridium sporogenes]MCW6064745.1 hypothetical protein [Clostridium sporogenes]OQP88528.1 hypothetical protein VT93_0201720 [Clostridium sporogenes]